VRAVFIIVAHIAIFPTDPLLGISSVGSTFRFIRIIPVIPGYSGVSVIRAFLAYSTSSPICLPETFGVGRIIQVVGYSLSGYSEFILDIWVVRVIWVARDLVL
jgi:hypothetical protein